jgi:hypothetical protein
VERGLVGPGPGASFGHLHEESDSPLQPAYYVSSREKVWRHVFLLENSLYPAPGLHGALSRLVSESHCRPQLECSLSLGVLALRILSRTIAHLQI